MKVDKKYKLKKFTNRYTTKKYLDYIHKYNESNVEVTNGYYMARVPAKDIEGEFYSPKQNYPLINDKSGKNLLEFVPSVDVKGKYPDIDSIIPKKEDIIYTIGIDAKMLYDLSKLIGSQKLKIGIVRADKAILVSPIDKSNSSIGVIMPLASRDYDNYGNYDNYDNAVNDMLHNALNKFNKPKEEVK